MSDAHWSRHMPSYIQGRLTDEKIAEALWLIASQLNAAEQKSNRFMDEVAKQMGTIANPLNSLADRCHPK